MDGRTLSKLTGDRFPMIFGEPEESDDALPFLGSLKEEMRRLQQEGLTLRAMREEAERYAWSLEAEIDRIRKMRAAAD